MPSGPIIVLGEMRAVRRRPSTSKVCWVMSQVQRSASPTASRGPNFLSTVLGPIPMRGPDAVVSRGDAEVEHLAVARRA